MLGDATVRITTYVSDATKEKWTTHLEKVRPHYTGLSHFIEEACEYKIQADNDFLNKAIEGLGIPAVGPLRRNKK